MVMVLDVQSAVTPVGSPEAAPIPVAPVVVCVILIKAVLIHNVGLDEAPVVVFTGVTVILPVAFTLLQPPVNGIL